MATALTEDDQPLSSSPPPPSSFPQTSSLPKFSKYEKMYEGTMKYVGPEIDRIKEWVVMEKIHGANLSLTVWNKESGQTGVKIGRRNDFLKDGENFYGMDTQLDLQKELYECSERLWTKMKEPCTSIIIYGELFGGYYPHPTIPLTHNGVVSVQKEVAYCPDLKFCAYDIAICNNHDKVYMDYDKAMDMFTEAGFMYSKPLLCGSLEEATNYPLGFVSTLPAKFSLPPIENNLAEGVVVKPLKNSSVMTHKGLVRVILKFKIPKFSERRALPRPQEHVQALEERKNNYQANENVQALKYEICALVTEQRLTNTLSKTGIPQNKGEWNKVKDELVTDVLESLKEENEELWARCQDDHVAITSLTNEAKKQCGILLSQHKKKLPKS